MGIHVYMHTHMHEANIENMADAEPNPPKRSSEASCSSPAKIAKTADSEQMATPPAKQITLAAIMRKQGSPCEIIRQSSPGAKPQQSLLEVLQGEITKDAPKAKSETIFVEGVEGEDHQVQQVKNGSRDRSHRFSNNSSDSIAKSCAP